MASILDIRRRIRSFANMRQITRAMKMISAARLRRAQERALAARPYAQMVTNVLKSLVARAEIYDPDTGELRNPLLVRRPENNITVIVVSGEKGLAGAFNSNILKAAMNFMASRQGKKIDIVAVGKKARDFFHRRYPAATDDGERRADMQITREYVGLLNRVQVSGAREIGEAVVGSYTAARTDAVYL